MSRTLRLALVLATTFGAACGSEDIADTNDPRQLRVSLSTELDTVPQWATHQLHARVTDVAGLLQSATVTWASTNPDIASVVGGLVTGIAPGTARIVAGAEGSADTTVIVVTEDEILVDIQPSAASVMMGDTLRFTAVARTLSGRTIPADQIKWSSSDSLLASFADDGIVVTKGEGDVTVSAEALSQRGGSEVKITRSTPASVSISPTTSNVYVGATLQLRESVRDANGRNIPDADVTWGSSDVTLATVSQDGKVTGGKPGDVVITATSGTRTASATIYVMGQPAKTIDLVIPADTLFVGASLQATATPRDASGTTVQGRAIAWQSSNPSVATVTGDGLIQGIAAGSSTISAISDGVVARKPIAVRSSVPADPSVASVAVTPGAVTREVGETVTLTALAYDADHNLLNGRVTTWRSLNPSVAAVSTGGVVTAVSAGTTQMEASIDGQVGSSAITVTAAAPAAVARVIVSLGAASLQSGQSTQATAVLNDAAGKVLTGRSITWSSLDPTVATVSSSGMVSAVGAGTVAIVARSEDVSGSASLTVASTIAAPVASVTVSVPSTSLNVGQQVQAVVTLKDATGNVLTGRTITYSTERSTVASVSSSGVITGVGSGSTRIQVTSGTVSGSVTMNVASATIANISVSLNPSTILAGATSQASVILRDATGQVLTGPTVTFSSSKPSVATVTAGGVVTALAAGVAVIMASSGGVTGSASLTVSAPPSTTVASVTVALSPATIAVGGIASTAVILRDASGAALTGRVVTYTSTNTTVASVSSSGVVTGLQQGTADIRVTSEGVTNSALLTVQPLPTGASQAELPRSEPVVPSTLSTLACTVTVPAGGLQSALNAARGGAVLCLTGTHTGNFTVPARTDAGWVVIRSAGAIPGGRIRPSTAGSLAKIVSPNTVSALRFNARSARTLVLGVEITSVQSLTNGPVALIEVGSGETSIADLPADIAFERVYAHGWPAQNVRRAFALNGGAQTVKDSWCSEIHAAGFDSQCVISWNGSGPILVENNMLEAASENVMLGGADAKIFGLVPSDVTIRRNHISKPIAWKGDGWNVKNLIETKSSARVLIEGNVLDGTWLEGQVGYAFVLKSTNQNGNCRWCSSSDWTIRRNLIRNVGAGITFGGRADNTVTDSSNRRMVVEENWFEPINVGQFTGDARGITFTRDNRDLVIRKNVFEGGSLNSVLLFASSGDPARNLTVTNNTLARGTYGLFTGGSSEGLQSWTNGPQGIKTWNANALIGSTTAVYPPGTSWHSSVSAGLTAAGAITRSVLDAFVSGVVIQP